MSRPLTGASGYRVRLPSLCAGVGGGGTGGPGPGDRWLALLQAALPVQSPLLSHHLRPACRQHPGATRQQDHRRRRNTDAKLLEQGQC